MTRSPIRTAAEYAAMDEEWERRRKERGPESFSKTSGRGESGLTTNSALNHLRIDNSAVVASYSKALVGQQVLAIDIGGQGVKHARFEHRDELHRVSEVAHWVPRDWSQFVVELDKRVPLGGLTVGVSCAGFVDTLRGVVRLSRAANWESYPVVAQLKARGAKEALVFNDAEAHLLAHYTEPWPLLNIAVGTSIGVAVFDDTGRFIRPRQNGNLDVGEFLLHTSSSRKQAWEALGKDEFDKLLKKEGPKEGPRRYGYRLGAFIGQLTTIFQPTTIVVSGGLTEGNWNLMSGPIVEEVQNAKPGWLEMPGISRSRQGQLAALVGVANAVLHGVGTRT